MLKDDLYELYDGVYIKFGGSYNSYKPSIILDMNKGFKLSYIYVDEFTLYREDKIKVFYEDSTGLIYQYNHLDGNISVIIINKITRDVGIYESADVVIYDFIDYKYTLTKLRRISKGLSVDAKIQLCTLYLDDYTHLKQTRQLIGLGYCGRSLIFNYDLLILDESKIKYNKKDYKFR